MAQLKVIIMQLSYKNSRRHFQLLKIILIIILTTLIVNTKVRAQQQDNSDQDNTDLQDNFDVITHQWLQYSDARNSLYHYLTSKAYEMLDARLESLEKLYTVEEWRKRQTTVRQTLWNILGPFTKKTNLNTKITSIVKKNGYHVENIIYESVPGFYVTASLFIPDKVKTPAPAILFCCGHSSKAYRRELYQRPLLNLVMKGFIVLAIDPIGQGERLEYLDSSFDSEIQDSSNSPCPGHSYSSVQVSLLGKSIARYFIWDGIRGIDYLVSRKEVDPTRIGVHGLSGGGTQAAYISALDERVVASAPAGYITSFKRLLESVGVGDGEQNLYHEISKGIDQADFVVARAPKPTLIMATTGDFFSIQGTRETYAKLKAIYSIFGKADNIEMTEDDGEHGYTKKNREAMYAFFQKYLRLPGSPTEEKVDFCSSRELQKTSTGQLSTSLGGETVFSLNKKEAEKMINKLQISREHLPGYRIRVLNSARKLSGYQKPKKVQNPVFTGRFKKGSYVVEKYFVKGEGNYVIPYLLMIPDKPNNKALLYLYPSGKAAADSSEKGELEWFIKNGFTVLIPDLIGLGEMGPGVFTGDSFISGVPYNLWFTSLIVDKSIVGIRSADVVRLTMLLKKRKGINEVDGIARKEMAPVLLYASSFDTTIKRVGLIDSYTSYQSIVMNRFYCPCFVPNLVPGALSAYDLPDLEASLAPRKLMMVGTTDGDGKKTDQEGINKDLEIIKNVYHLKNASGKLIISPPVTDNKLHDLFREWIK